MFSKIIIALALLVGAQSFTPLPASRVLAPQRQATIVQGTFIEDFKFKKQFNRFTFKTFAECLEKADMAGELAKGDVTIFAPSDAAFEEMGKAGVDELMGNPELLKKMIEYHMLPGIQDGPSFRNDNEKKLMTKQGTALTVDSDGKSAYVDDAKVDTYDVQTDEGIFHIIDWVNMPK